jgi:hypothetical protein
MNNFFDAVGISDVPVTSGFDVKPPNELLASAELGNVVATVSGNRVATASGNVVATAFNDDLMRRVNDKTATFVHDDSTGNAAALAC